MSDILVTGMGVVSAIGVDRPRFVDNLFAGHSGAADISAFDTSRSLVKVAAEARDYRPEDHFDAQQLNYLDRFTQLGLVATRQALEQAGLDIRASGLGPRTAAIYGTGVGGQNTQEENYRRVYQDNAKRLHPFVVPKLIPSAGVSQLSLEFGIQGPSFAIASACSSASHAIANAWMLLKNGMADVAVCGGAEACITYGTLKAWEGLRVMTPTVCRPFCKDRNGMLIGEGAGTLILETREHAEARGAHVLAELAGIGFSSDAHHSIQPSDQGAARAMQAALDSAQLAAGDIQYINAHGTGTPQNDPTETRAIRVVFAEQADGLAVSSTKAMHGHALGAAGALEAIASIAALEKQCAPATINFTEAAEDCDLDYVANQARKMAIEHVLSNSFAFGGLNVSLVFSRPGGKA